MQQDLSTRTRTTPRAILLGAIEAATIAGSPDDLITEIWAHAALVARLARDIAPMAAVDPDEASGAGLVHDVGELLLLAQPQSSYVTVGAWRLHHGEQLEVEKSTFGVDHALLAADHLLEHRLPHVIADAVADHHDPYRTSDPTTIVVAAADEIAHLDPNRRHAQSLLGITPEMATTILVSNGQRDPGPNEVRARRVLRTQ